MIKNIINYYKKITDLALINIKDEKKFQFKSKLNNKLLMIQSEQQLINTWKKASGNAVITKEARIMIDQYKSDIQKMHTLAVADYNKTLKQVKEAKTVEEKQKILNKLAERGFSGHNGEGGTWNIETYSNMYFRHVNNSLVRMGVVEKSEKVRISSHSTLCKVCGPWEGKELTKAEAKRILGFAEGTHIFHPNCLHYFIEVK